MSEEIQRFVDVPFMGAMIKATNDDKHYVALKPLVEEIGLKWNGVLVKIKNNPALSSTMHTACIVAEDGKIREMVCLPLNKINGMLFLINPEDYNHKKEVKEKLMRYQEKCYDVLYEYFNKGISVHPALAMQPHEVQMQAFQNAINNAVSNALEMAKSQMEQMTNEFRRTKAWISDKKTATALQRNSVLKRRINTLEREKQEMIDEYDDEIDDLKDRLTIEENDAYRYRSWRSKVGRPRKGGRMDDSMYLF